MKLYHGTSSANVESILKEGLLPGTNGYHNPADHVEDSIPSIFFTPYKNVARIFGEAIIETDLDIELPRKFYSEPKVKSMMDIDGKKLVLNITVDIAEGEPPLKESDFEYRHYEKIPPEKLRLSK